MSYLDEMKDFQSVTKICFSLRQNWYMWTLEISAQTLPYDRAHFKACTRTF